MPKFTVIVKVKLLEFYTVEADSAEEAAQLWDEGDYLGCDETHLDAEPVPGETRDHYRMEETMTHILPPDPEHMNDDRASWAGQALACFSEATGSDQEDAVCDLLADLMHWCDRHGMSFPRELDRAHLHYAAETLGDAEEFCFTNQRKDTDHD